MKVIILGLLCAGFWMSFRQVRFTERMGKLVVRTRLGMGEVARQRALDGRRQRRLDLQKATFWTTLERWLYYTGAKLRFPKLTPEIWLALHLMLLAVVAVISGLFRGKGPFWGLVSGIFLLEAVVMGQLRNRNLRRVNEHLMKLLDFLGNYSITSGEVTGILFQVSRYMEYPLKTVLEGCYYEAQTTGDAGMALLEMAEKIEHPKFKELACNMEVSLRYCADFTVLVAGSRRSLREYLKSARERKGMLREALISMLLLLGMSLVILMAVSSLVQKSMVELTLGTMPGRIGLGVLGIIGLLFISQMNKTHY